MGSSRLRVRDPHLERKDGAGLSDRPLPLPTFDVPYFKYIDEEDEDDAWSSRSQSSTEDDSVDSLLSDRYVVVSGTPEKILEHLLNDLHLEEVQDKETGKTGLSPASRLSRGCPCQCVSLGASLPLWPPGRGLLQRLLRAPPPRPLPFCLNPLNGHMEIRAAAGEVAVQRRGYAGRCACFLGSFYQTFPKDRWQEASVQQEEMQGRG